MQRAPPAAARRGDRRLARLERLGPRRRTTGQAIEWLPFGFSAPVELDQLAALFPTAEVHPAKT